MPIINTRKDHAIGVKDHMVSLIIQFGRAEERRGPFEMLFWRTRGFSFLYRLLSIPPLGLHPALTIDAEALACMAQFAEPLPYNLDVWEAGCGKGMNFAWDGRGRDKLVSFRKGDWFERVLAIRGGLSGTRH